MKRFPIDLNSQIKSLWRLLKPKAGNVITHQQGEGEGEIASRKDKKNKYQSS